MRRSGVPLQRIRPALTRLEEQFGLRYALASKRLYTDGAEVLFDYAETGDDPPRHVPCATWSSSATTSGCSTRSSRRTYAASISALTATLGSSSCRHTRPQTWSSTPHAASGSRSLRGGARLEDVLALFRAGEPLDVVAAEYGIPREHLEDAVRIATRPAA